jgi:hypothetical protein
VILIPCFDEAPHHAHALTPDVTLRGLVQLSGSLTTVARYSEACGSNVSHHSGVGGHFKAAGVCLAPEPRFPLFSDSSSLAPFMSSALRRRPSQRSGRRRGRVRRVEEQLKRSAGVLPEPALAEYRAALRAYEELAKSAR